MMTKDKQTLDMILKHKEHFDSRLIDIAASAESMTDSLRTEVFILKNTNSQLSKQLKDAHLSLAEKDKKIEHLKDELDESHRDYDDLLNYLRELEKEVERQRKQIDEKSRQVDELVRKNNEFYEKMNRKIKKLESTNSTNSNMSTSFDVLSHTVSKANANTRKKTDKKRGGQIGHEVHKSPLLKCVDEVIVVHVNKAPTGAVKCKDENENIYYVTQEIDMTFTRKVTETQYYVCENGQRLDESVMKKYAINSVSYASHFKAQMVYFCQRGTIPYQRLCEMMEEMSEGEIKVRPSTIVNWNQEALIKSPMIKNEILQTILQKGIVHVDETGIKVNGKNHWMHVITNEKGSYFVATEKRKDIERGPLKLLSDYKGIAVHDHYKPYQELKNCTHAECNAHIDRYLRCGIDIDKNEECKQMLELLHEMLARKNELISQEIYKMDEEEILEYERRYLEIARTGLEKYYREHPNVEKKYQPEYVPTFKRLIVYKEDHLRFIKDFRVPYTNNAAERQCRAVKAKKKVSGQFVSKANADAYADILTLIQTAKLHNQNTLAIIENLFG